MISYTDDEIKAEHQIALDELPNRCGEPIDKIRERYANEFGYHEALHTASIFMENVDSYLLEHPAVILDEAIYGYAFNAHTALFNLYQAIGARRFAQSEAEDAPADDTSDDDFSFDEKAEAAYETRRLPWLYVRAHLNTFHAFPVEQDKQLRTTLDTLETAFLEEDGDEIAPSPGSFYVLLHLLAEHPELPIPGIALNREGNFCAVWQHNYQRWSLEFQPWEIRHGRDRPTGRNIEVTEVDTSAGFQYRVNTTVVSLDEIEIPDWLRVK